MIYKAKELLIKHEGKTNKPYLCPAGKRTIGIGHNITDKGLPKDIAVYLDKHKKIADEMVNTLFASDLMDAVSGCMKLYPKFNEFSEARRLALVDFLFNVGIGTAQQFKNTNAAINGDNWEKAAQGLEKSLWFTQVGKRGPEIVKMIREG